MKSLNAAEKIRDFLGCNLFAVAATPAKKRAKKISYGANLKAHFDRKAGEVRARKAYSKLAA
ncbi:hypothetical protein [Bradyrhizobium sp. BWC-3-1]|uniref:hypothetical protein n=1 Tax=Bradyrhizobium sp. BWC-3-1 TaxID=3080012 RepID=UPI00293EB85B|nr:hypothetical protein [Bradyrhizobium sp. BWC-3-1]WOH61948.1 hypothetical protein RX329_18375 [Bradyrhizobium sp. BWC-3-1]